MSQIQEGLEGFFWIRGDEVIVEKGEESVFCKRWYKFFQEIVRKDSKVKGKVYRFGV